MFVYSDISFIRWLCCCVCLVLRFDALFDLQIYLVADLLFVIFGVYCLNALLGVVYLCLFYVINGFDTCSC